MKHYEMYYYSNHRSFGGYLTRRFFATDADDAIEQAKKFLAVKVKGETEARLLSVYLV